MSDGPFVGNEPDDARCVTRGTFFGATYAADFPGFLPLFLFGEVRLMGTKARMVDLCLSFPSLRGVPGTKPWDQYEFAEWASGPEPGSGAAAPSSCAILAAQFVLSVWSGSSRDPWWDCGTFDVVRAFTIWDDAHQAAFLEWCKSPILPRPKPRRFVAANKKSNSNGASNGATQ